LVHPNHHFNPAYYHLLIPCSSILNQFRHLPTLLEELT
jgi:hypothetical protein